MSGWWFVLLGFCIFFGGFRGIIAWCLLVFVFSAMGCASNTLSPEELERRQYNRQASIENWTLCEQVYEMAGEPTYHDGHSHQGMSTSTGSRIRRGAYIDHIKQDLSTNGCRRILGEHWIDSI